MTAPDPDPSRVVQEFRPTNGGVVGWTALVVAVAAGISRLAADQSWSSVQVALGLALLAAVVWVTLLRPRAAATGDTLILRNMVRDVHVPLARIDSVAVRQTLNVWVGSDRYVCVGIGRSARSLIARRHRGSMSQGPLSWSGPGSAGVGVGHAPGEESAGAGPYDEFVESRILDLADSARRDQQGDPGEVRRAWAVPELVVLGVLGGAFVGSLLLG